MEPLTNKPTDQELINVIRTTIYECAKIKVEDDGVKFERIFQKEAEAILKLFKQWNTRHESAKCDSDHLSIDELLSEFKRQGFNTENWDGEEGAEKAVVDGVVNAMNTVVNDLTSVASESAKTGVEEIVEAVMNQFGSDYEYDTPITVWRNVFKESLTTALQKLLEK